MSDIDLTGIISDRRNVALWSGLGGFLIHWLEPGVYEAHSMFPPEARGAHAMQAAREGMEYMFGETDCETLMARCPKGNIAVLAFTRALRFEFDRTEPKAWPTVRGNVDQRWFRMTRDRWIEENARCQ